MLQFFRWRMPPCEVVGRCISQAVACSSKLSDTLVQRLQIKMRSQVAFLLKLAKKLLQRRAIKSEIKRQYVRIRKAQSNEAPHAREGDVVFKRGIADM